MAQAVGSGVVIRRMPKGAPRASNQVAAMRTCSMLEACGSSTARACRSALNRVKGMPFAWSLNPYTGCAHAAAPSVTCAPSRQRADQPPTTATGARSGSRSTWPRCWRASSAGARGRRSRSHQGRHRPVSAGRGALPADAGVPRGVQPGPPAVRDHHARAADRSRRRRAPGCGAAGRCRCHLLRPDARPRGLADGNRARLPGSAWGNGARRRVCAQASASA